MITAKQNLGKVPLNKYTKKEAPDVNSARKYNGTKKWQFQLKQKNCHIVIQVYNLTTHQLFIQHSIKILIVVSM